MTFFIYRSLLTVTNGRASVLTKHGVKIAEHAPCIFIVQSDMMHGNSISKRSIHSATKFNNSLHIFRRSNLKEFHNVQGTRLASTFVVETPGKVVRPVTSPEIATNPGVESLQTVPTSSPTTASNVPIDPIPEPPPIPWVESAESVNASAETTFASLGLGGWSPVGIVENCMEFLHVDCGIPWYGAIAIGTLCVRLVLFPLVIVAQRNAAKMNNNMPQLQLIQLRMTEARQTGNHLEAARYAQELMLFMKEKQLNPLKNMVVPFAQAPLFISFFMALRGMANLPVPDMITGGLWWFTDLTMPDQYFLLPLFTSATLFLTIELGVDSARLSTSNMHVMKYVLRALPVCIFPFTVNFPGAVLCYWLSSNVISLAQVGILKIPAVRAYCKIDPLMTIDPQTLPVKPKGFVEGFKDSYNNLKITREMEERQRFDEMQFRRAGTAPIQKTFKYDPTRSREAISAKKRDN